MVQQMLLLASLAVLPIIMVGLDGAAAVRSLFTPVSRLEPIVDASPTERSPSAPQAVAVEKLQFGIYDPAGLFAGESDFGIRHEYISWLTFDANKLAERLKTLTEQGIHPLLTIEPWPAGDEENGHLLRSVANGKYDSHIDRVADCLRGLEGPVYLSWGHEMDQDLAQRYPWSGRNPDEYITAYRYVVDRIRKQVTTELHWVWAGVLKEGSLRYWPGETYADCIGMPIYSCPDWDQRNYGYIRDFRTTFEEKRKLVQQLRKPLIITELGVSGSTDFVNFWLHQAFVSLQDYPDLKAVVFFYAKDAEGVWGSDVPTPDWRVHPDLIRGLVAWKLH